MVDYQHKRQTLVFAHNSLQIRQPNNLKIPMRTTESEIEELWDYLVETETATSDELRLITDINGYNLESLESVFYCRTGYRSLDQLKELEE